MYTIRPCSAGVIVFDGPHAEIAIANIAAIADLKKGPKMDCTVENCARARRFRILAKDLCRASHAMRSEQRRELVHRDFYCPNNCPQSAAIKRRMHGDCYRIAALADQADVTTLLPRLPIAKLTERFDAVASRYSRHLLWENSETDLAIKRSQITSASSIPSARRAQPRIPLAIPSPRSRDFPGKARSLREYSRALLRESVPG